VASPPSPAIASPLDPSADDPSVVPPVDPSADDEVPDDPEQPTARGSAKTRTWSAEGAIARTDATLRRFTGDGAE
jgi:hypothetical protein